MPLHLVSSSTVPSPLDHNVVTRLRYSRRHPRVRDEHRPKSGAEVIPLVMAGPNADGGEQDSAEGFAPDEGRLDHLAIQAQAEQEDLALVRLAAGKLAVALREVHVLLGRDRAAWKREALARCTARGWITVQGDDGAALQTFRVTPDGYRAAGLKVPPFGP